VACQSAALTSIASSSIAQPSRSIRISRSRGDQNGDRKACVSARTGHARLST
jgi:hypothetical protein